MNKKALHRFLTIFIGLVWLVNGLYSKVLNFEPRHQEIVASILGDSHARLLIILIGSGEILMAIWVFSQFKSRLNAISQIVLVAVMNALEFILVPDLLLWGRWNALFAFLFILLVYYHGFPLKKKLS